MSEVAIKVEQLSKQYRLGQVGTGTISHDLNRWWYQVRGKENPYLKIGDKNDRTVKGDSDYTWALKDIDFEVKKGEIIGVIGRNGAGKSTLLKVLSKITSPTTGCIKTKGRIASLLEVGTGFHPEMTGRENIYMNGTIMGMSRYEISKKLDQIVDFAGIERYLDTPAKRYSSGMTVRLGFSIAAHLEPEILVVDEVLAVGDAEFQKKAIGKMQDVSQGEGRTILFVSHNMSSVKSLCDTGLLMENGMITYKEEINKVITKYMEGEFNESSTHKKWNLANALGNDEIKIHQVEITDSNSNVKDLFTPSQDLFVRIEYEIYSPLSGMRINLNLQAASGGTVFQTSSHEYTKQKEELGKFELIFIIPKNLLNRIKYIIYISAGIPGYRNIIPDTKVLSFEIDGISSHGSNFSEKWEGVIAPKIECKLIKK